MTEEIKKRYIKAKIELIKVELNLLNDVSGPNMPWDVKRKTKPFEDELNEEFKELNEEKTINYGIYKN